MPTIPSLTSFTPGTTILSSDVNSNFTSIRSTVNDYALLSDVARTVTVTNVWTVSQTFTGGMTVKNDFTAFQAGQAMEVTTSAVATNTAVYGAVYDMKQTVTNSGTAYGLISQVRTTHTTGTVAQLQGVVAYAKVEASGAATTARGMEAVSWLASASAGLASGIGILARVINTSASGVSHAAAIQTGFSNTGSGTFTKAIGLEIPAITVASTNFAIVHSGIASTVLAGATLATAATSGFLYISTVNGTPTGTPNAETGVVPLVVDVANNKLYFYSGGAWRDAGP